MFVLRRTRKLLFGSKKGRKSSSGIVSQANDAAADKEDKGEKLNKDFNYTTQYDMHMRDELCASSDLNAIRKEVLRMFVDKSFPISQIKYLNSDHAVSRYLVAAKMNQSQAAKNLAATLLWRESRGLLDDSTPSPDHYHNSFVPVGLDRRKYVVIYSNHARAEPPINSNAESQFDHAFRVIETACDDSLGIQRTLWVIDFNGFSMKHICKRHIVLGCSWFGAHNPERLG
jgi:hypothetical protein